LDCPLRAIEKREAGLQSCSSEALRSLQLGQLSVRVRENQTELSAAPGGFLDTLMEAEALVT
jgi:hypothetical protein